MGFGMGGLSVARAVTVDASVTVGESVCVGGSVIVAIGVCTPADSAVGRTVAGAWLHMVGAITTKDDRQIRRIEIP